MDGLRDGPGGLGPLGAPGALTMPAGVAHADAVRLFGAAYRMLGSACAAREVVREAFGAPAGARGGDAAGDPYGRLVREVFGAVLRRQEPVRTRRDGQTHTAPWLPEPVLTAGGALGPLDSAERRASVSLGRLVLLERLGPEERAAHVLQEVFGYGSADAAALLSLPEARYRTLGRRAWHRIQEAEGPARPPESEAQRWSAVAELLRAIREEDTAALEELLADDVVAWSDGGGQPGVVRRPIHGAAKVGRFLAAVKGRIPEAARGHAAEVNGDAALVAAVGAEVVGVLAPEFGPQGMVGLRAVADPARLVFLSRQWGGWADRPGSAD